MATEYWHDGDEINDGRVAIILGRRARHSDEDLAQRGPQPTKKYQPDEKVREAADLCAEKVLQAHKTLAWHDRVKLTSIERTLTFERRYLPTPDQHLLGVYETWICVNKV